ncbi:hypothetical protein NQZ68_005594 [Dissostichus eleginoides]|nr:hypothetical protein NQZ68_005594 [Dissostichus eleginoides]
MKGCQCVRECAFSLSVSLSLSLSVSAVWLLGGGGKGGGGGELAVPLPASSMGGQKGRGAPLGIKVVFLLSPGCMWVDKVSDPSCRGDTQLSSRMVSVLICTESNQREYITFLSLMAKEKLPEAHVFQNIIV